MSQSNPQNHSKFAQTFISYGSYHSNLINKIIHIICIPIITATFLAMLTYIPYHVNIAGYQIGAFHLIILLSLLYYLSIGVSAAVIMGVAIGLGILLWNWAFQNANSTQTRNAIILLNVGGWIFQFIGHGVFEKRKPALLDNLSQIYSAPLFVIIELFDLIGIRSKQMQVWNVEIEKRVKQFQSKQKQSAKVK